MKRRHFLASAATAIAGCSTKDREGEVATPKTRSKGLSEAEYQARELKEDIDSLNPRFGRRALFVGNPNNYDHGPSYVSIYDNPDQSKIFDKIDAGYSGQEIWYDFLKEKGYEESKILDQKFPDPLDYDLIERQKLDILVLNSSEADIEGPIQTTKSNFEEVMGVDTTVSLEDSRAHTKNDLIEIGRKNPDSMVYHVFSDEENSDLGTAAYDRNIARINYNEIKKSVRPEDALSRVMDHEGYHAMANMPHLLSDLPNLMSVSIQDPAEAVLTPQAEEMIENYISSELEYRTETRDGRGRVKIGFFPPNKISNGEEYLLQNTRKVLDLDEINFPREKWDLTAREDKLMLQRDGVTAFLHPDEIVGYKAVDVLTEE